MSKFLLRAIAPIAIFCLAGNVNAQTPTAPKPTLAPALGQPAPTPATTPAVPTPTATPTPAATNNPDFQLLGKAIGLFWQGNRATTESQIVMTLQPKSKNAPATQINAKVKTIAQTGDRFRAELTLVRVASPLGNRVGSPAKISYTAICDGKNVWLYRADKRQYSQLPFAEFKPLPHSLLVGLSTVFFVSASETDRQSVMTALGVKNNFLELIPAKERAGLQGFNRQVDGRNFYVYSYDNKEEKLNFSGFVQPETGIVKRIEYTADTERGNFKVVETILTHTTSNDSGDRLFKFSPPRGTRKVKSLLKNLNKFVD